MGLGFMSLIWDGRQVLSRVERKLELCVQALANGQVRAVRPSAATMNPWHRLAAPALPQLFWLSSLQVSYNRTMHSST
jgi:hypothetical protein